MKSIPEEILHENGGLDRSPRKRYNDDTMKVFRLYESKTRENS